ncbi:sulfatase family protein [Alloyangia pacifica]|uniref:Arylsulfatase A n=1 Tax=Alloyangia pacifica TaxID=311180 RepID=A0A1I6SWV8_9RHOB|nr:sulfatase [Alloyangia pacifica]SDG89989.1 Arylsulfatase A [Alloyangia pacifica]SFS81373.1 Arylsulfatase A [Alloyangia pacifica]
MTRPNIIFIMSDDHASRAISAYGAGINATPNLDRLADEGVRHDATYVTNSICTPSRAAILCGTHNHVNGVTTLETHIDNRLPNVAKSLQANGYATAIFGKWHLGEGPAHEPTGFDEWAVVPGQGDYWDPAFYFPDGKRRVAGYATDVITDMSVDFIERHKDAPFFLMCHHKAPHRNWQYHPRYRDIHAPGTIPLPPTFEDDYANRAAAAAVAKMRVKSDMLYEDLGLVQPEGGTELAGELMVDYWPMRKIPEIAEGESITVICAETGENFTFDDPKAFAEFKYQRYMSRYLRTVQAIDDGVGVMLDKLDELGLTENTIVIYTSDQGFFLGEHGWFDKRFMYEESYQMPFLCRYPAEIPAGITSKDICCNVDFAATFLDWAGVPVPSYMQGVSMRQMLTGETPADWEQVAYHRYWMNNDEIHNAYAHYGVRDQRYKLIYWYNDDLGQLGARPGEIPPEWELFDCEQDPMELMNVAADPAYAEVFADLLAKLDAKQAAIGDIPQHDSTAVLASLSKAA